MVLLRMLDRCHVHCVRHKLTPRRHFPLSLSDNEIVSEIMESRVTPLSACDREFTHRDLCHSDARPSIFKQPHHPHGLNTNEATSHVFMQLANTTKNMGIITRVINGICILKFNCICICLVIPSQSCFYTIDC